MEKEKEVGKEAEKEIGKETEKKKKINPIKVLLRNTLKSPTTLLAVCSGISGIIAFIIGIYTKLYWEEYYSYFEIDLRYVSKNYYWNLTDFIISFGSLFILFLVFYFILISLNDLYKRFRHYKNITAEDNIDPKVISYFRRDLLLNSIVQIVSTLITIYGLFFFYNAIISPFYDKQGTPHDGRNYYLKALNSTISLIILLLCIIVIIICFIALENLWDKLGDQIERSLAKNNKKTASLDKIERVYFKIFPNKIEDKEFEKRQKDAITKYLKQSSSKREDVDKILLIPVVIIFFFFISIGFPRQNGADDAFNQKEFLVTEDNKHVAIPISESRYALIDIREEGDCLILLTGKQDFHESNDFPCIRKTYEEVRKEPLN